MGWLRALQKSVTGTHTAAYRALGGRGPLGRISGLDMLLLTTTGRKSGQRRTVPLMYVRHADGVALIASNGGSDTSPAWWLNLQANPAATVQMGGTTQQVRARKATPEEKEQVWAEMSSRYRPYNWYQSRTSRPIPVVILEPVGN